MREQAEIRLPAEETEMVELAVNLNELCGDFGKEKESHRIRLSSDNS